MNEKQKEFARVFKVPPALHPYLDSVASPEEMELVIAIGSIGLTESDLAKQLDLTHEELTKLLQSSKKHNLITSEPDEKGDESIYRVSSFYSTFTTFVMSGEWEGVPADAREAVIEWDMQEFINKHQPVLEKMIEDPDHYDRIPNRDVLLLEEVMEQIEASTDFAVRKCDCREIMMDCNYSRDVCVFMNRGAEMAMEFDGHSRRITKEECKRIMMDSNREGLIHTGLRGWKKYPEFLLGLCNCCACCCFPIRGAIRIDHAREWPRAHYTAVRDLEICKPCGTCAKRCQFDAFTWDKKNKQISFDPTLCWGCGICATGCPKGAINMIPLIEPKGESTA